MRTELAGGWYLTTDHAACSDGKAVLVDPKGDVYCPEDVFPWVDLGLAIQQEGLSPEGARALNKWGAGSFGFMGTPRQSPGVGRPTSETLRIERGKARAGGESR